MQLTRNSATLLGMLAPLFWGMSVGLVHTIGTTVGVTGGIFISNGLAAILALFVFGVPRLGDFSVKYLIWGLGTAVLSELCFPISMALSEGAVQTVEVGMVNYLWPSLTILAAILFNGQDAKWWVAIGLVLSFLGLAIVLSGERGLNIEEIVLHVKANPLSYFIALCGALSWVAYNSITKAFSNGKNPVVLVLAVNALLFGCAYAYGIGPRIEWSFSALKIVLLVAFIRGIAASVWNLGLVKGRMTLLGIASFFTPILSVLFSTWWLEARLGTLFWLGVCLVVAGSLIAWTATRKGSQA